MDEKSWADIRRLALHEKMKQRAIARHLGISRDLVAKALASETCPRRVASPRGSILDPYESALVGILAEYPTLSGVRLFEKLGELGYPGKLFILRARLRELRPRRPAEAFLKRESLPGQEAQADWGSCGVVACEGIFRPLSVFVMTLSFSRMLYVEFTVSQEMEDFLRCHVNAFNYFGGVPRRILYDNLRSVVQWRQGRLTRFNVRFQEFAGHFPFEAVACNPRRGNEKPRAETAVRYVKQNFLAGRQFDELAQIRSASFHWLNQIANVRLHATTGERPVDRFEREKPVLQPLHSVVPDTRLCRSVYVTHQARVALQGNTYSVPPQYVGQMLTLKAAPDRVWLYDQDREVASHPRSYGRYRDVEDSKHARAILALKQKGHLDKQRDEFLSLGPMAQQFVEGLVLRADTQPAYHIQKLLELVADYGRTAVQGALEHALRYRAFGADYVKNILLQKLGPDGQPHRPRPLDLSRHPELARHNVEEPDLSDYETLSSLEELPDDNDPDGTSD